MEIQLKTLWQKSEKVRIWAILTPFWAVTPELEFFWNMKLAAKWAPYRSLFTFTKPKNVGYFWRKIEKGPNLGHFDPFWAVTLEPEFCWNMQLAAKWAQYEVYLHSQNQKT